MNEPTTASAPTATAPVSPVSVQSPPPPPALALAAEDVTGEAHEDAPPVSPAATAPSESAPAEDQLPTSRMPSLLAPLPPPVPPSGPAHKTQRLRAISPTDATSRLARAAEDRKVWRTALAHLRRAADAARVLARREAWTERRIAMTCGAAGLLMIASGLVLGWQAVSLDRLERFEHAPGAAAVLVARALMAIATMAVGYGLVRIGERALPGGRGSHGGRSE
jgi:hypothetical protein